MSMPVRVVEEDDSIEFQEKCSQLVKEGYLLHSSSCGIINSEQYDFCSTYQAIFVLPEATVGGTQCRKK